MQDNEQNHIQNEFLKLVKGKKISIFLSNKKILVGKIINYDLYSLLFQPVNTEDNSLKLETNLIFKSAITNIAIEEQLNVESFNFIQNNNNNNKNKNNKEKNNKPVINDNNKKNKNINVTNNKDNKDNNNSIPSKIITNLPSITPISSNNEENNLNENNSIIKKDKFDFNEKKEENIDKNNEGNNNDNYSLTQFMDEL